MEEITDIDMNSFKDLLLQKCLSKFNIQMSLENCLTSLSKAVEFEKRGISLCLLNNTAPDVQHNPEFYSECGQLERHMNQFVVPVLLILCFVGNILNIIIYRLPYFNGSSSIHFLIAKAFANFVFVESRIFEVTHAWTFQPNASFEHFYWKSKIILITIANVSGTLSTWMTLLVTIETALCISIPFQFRFICTKRITLSLLAISLLMSILLHIIFVCLHDVIRTTTLSLRDDEYGKCYYGSKIYIMQISSGWMFLFYEKVYYWTHMMVAIIFPTFVMLFCAIIIIYQFSKQNFGAACMQRRKCVVRITVATTLSHLFLEGPASLTFTIAAHKGTGGADSLTCMLNHGNNLLSMINATIPFFVFLLCSRQFRELTIHCVQSGLSIKTLPRKMIFQLRVKKFRCKANSLDNPRTEETQFALLTLPSPIA